MRVYGKLMQQPAIDIHKVKMTCFPVVATLLIKQMHLNFVQTTPKHLSHPKSGKKDCEQAKNIGNVFVFIAQ